MACLFGSLHDPRLSLKLGAAAFLALFSLPLHADIVLNGTNQALAAMMSSAQDELSYLVVEFGAFGAPLSFTSQFTPTSFQYTANPGSLYNNAPISVVVNGSQTAPDSWTVTISSSFSGSAYVTGAIETGGATETFTDSIPGENEFNSGDVQSTINHVGDSHDWHWTSLTAWTQDPADASLLYSATTTSFAEDAGMPRGPVVRSGEINTLIDGSGNWGVSQSDVGGLVINGTFGPTGRGSFRASIVPEPSYGVPALIFMLVAGGTAAARGRSRFAGSR